MVSVFQRELFTMKKLTWLCSSPTPYNDFLFGALDKSINFDLDVVYRELYLEAYPWQSVKENTYKFRQMSGSFGIDRKLLTKIFSEKERVYVVGGWHPRFWVTILALVINSSKFMVWSDTPNDLNKRNFIKTKIRNFWLDLIFKHSVGLLCTGEPCVERFVSMGANRSKVFNFPLWVPLKDYPQISNKLEMETLEIISVGRIEEIKGFEYLVEAASRVRKLSPSLNIKYTVCGEGTFRHELEMLIKRNGLDDIFTITGWLEHEQILLMLDAADIYVHTAKWEPYGATILEAMAAALPILGSDNTIAVLDRVEHGKSGFIHETGNTAMLSEQIVALAENHNMRNTYAVLAYETSLQFPVSKGVENILEFFKQSSST